jgi:hypothetical protein
MTLEKDDYISMLFASAGSAYAHLNLLVIIADTNKLLVIGGLKNQPLRFDMILHLRAHGMAYLLWSRPLVVGVFAYHVTQWISLRGPGSCVKASYVDSF